MAIESVGASTPIVPPQAQSLAQSSGRATSAESVGQAGNQVEPGAAGPVESDPGDGKGTVVDVRT